MKICLLFLLSFVLCAGGVAYAQEPEEAQLSKKLESLEGKLQNIYGQIQELKKELEQNPTSEVQEKIDILAQEAGELEKRIQEINNRLQHKLPPEPGDEDRRPEGDKPSKKDPRFQREGDDMESPEMGERMEKLRQMIPPDKFQKLMEMRRRNPEQFRQQMRQFMEKFRGMNQERMVGPDKMQERMPDKDPAMQEIIQKQKKMDEQVRKLVHALRKAQGEERTKMVNELRQLLNDQFALRQNMREREIEKMNERLQQMKEKHQKRLQNKDMIVDRYLKNLLGEGDEWEW